MPVEGELHEQRLVGGDLERALVDELGDARLCHAELADGRRHHGIEGRRGGQHDAAVDAVIVEERQAAPGHDRLEAQRVAAEPGAEQGMLPRRRRAGRRGDGRRRGPRRQLPARALERIGGERHAPPAGAFDTAPAHPVAVQVQTPQRLEHRAPVVTIARERRHPDGVLGGVAGEGAPRRPEQRRARADFDEGVADVAGGQNGAAKANRAQGLGAPVGGVGRRRHGRAGDARDPAPGGRTADDVGGEPGEAAFERRHQR